MVDPAPHMEAVARHLLGEPNKALSSRTELRYGSNGSLAVDINRGLWHDHEIGTGGGVFDLIARETGCSNGAAVGWLHAELGIDVGAPRQARPRSGVVAEYTYTDAAGALVMQVLRYKPKTFKQRRPDGQGGWVWSVKGVDPVPYRLPALLKAAEIFICEGERDCDRLDTLGIVATCNPCGAGRWPASFAEHFQGRHVVIIPDNDEAGRDHGQDVARKLAGVAASIKVLELSGLPAKGDVSDFLDAGGSTERLLELAEDTPEWQATVEPPVEAVSDEEACGRFFEFPWQFKDPQPPTLIAGLLAHGEEFLVYGPPEAGKSFFMVDMACRWAVGDTWRGRKMARGLVIYLAGERAESIRRRILGWALRHGFKPAEIPIAVLKTSLNLLSPDDEELQRLAGSIQAASRIVGLPAITIIGDTIHSLSPGSKEDNHSFGVVMSQCRKLRDLLEQEIPPALGYVHHTGKDEDRGPRGGNSITASVSVSMSITVRLGKYRLIEIDKANDLPGDKPHIEPFVIDDVTLRHAEDGTPVTTGVHAAMVLAEVPNLPDEELKRIALGMHRDGKSQRTIAKAIGRSASTVNAWITGETKRSGGACR